MPKRNSRDKLNVTMVVFKPRPLSASDVGMTGHQPSQSRRQTGMCRGLPHRPLLPGAVPPAPTLPLLPLPPSHAVRPGRLQSQPSIGSPLMGMSSQRKAPATRAKSAKLANKKRSRPDDRPVSAVAAAVSASSECLLQKRSLQYTPPTVTETEATVSASSKIDLSEILSQRRQQQYQPLSAGEYVHKYLCRAYDATMGKTRQQSKFPIMDLPDDCLLKVFSFLDAMERGAAAQVCRRWNSLMHQSSLWTVVDLTTFSLCSIEKQGHHCDLECYQLYRTRMKKFIQHLQALQPVIRRLSFAFDIYDTDDRWLESIEGLIKASHCQELNFAQINWKDTPVKPFWVEQISYPVHDLDGPMHRHRHRQRRFVQLLDLLTKRAPNITKMVMQFDWSLKSLEFIGRLKNLNTLVLERYFVFQPMAQDSLDQLFKCLPSLVRLILEIWTPSGKGLILYQIRSPILVYLDVSHCRGFYLGGLQLPKLSVFKVTRHPWNGPLTCADSINVPCIYEVLKTGAPNLKQLNEHTLQPNWTEVIYPELHTVLRAVCSCRRHKSGNVVL